MKLGCFHGVMGVLHQVHTHVRPRGELDFIDILKGDLFDRAEEGGMLPV